jgi:hypothetical protein
MANGVSSAILRMRGVGGDIDSEFELKKNCVDKTENGRD